MQEPFDLPIKSSIIQEGKGGDWDNQKTNSSAIDSLGEGVQPFMGC
jgi:hypothetical protein